MRILASVLFAVSLSAAPMTTIEREHLVSHLEMTESWLADEISGLTEAQLKFRPAPGKWTILDVVEHLTVAEPQYWHDLKESMTKPRRRPRIARRRTCTCFGTASIARSIRKQERRGSPRGR
jgi:hypothetical protein